MREGRVIYNNENLGVHRRNKRLFSYYQAKKEKYKMEANRTYCKVKYDCSSGEQQ